MLTQYKPQDEIVFQANANYWGDDDPTLQRLVYRIIPDDSAALIAYQNGEIDMTAIPLADTDRFQGNPEQVRFAQLETYAIQYNVTKAPLDNPLVREAISRAIDRSTYVAAIHSDIGQPALAWIPPGMPGADPTAGQDLGFDPAAAQALLAQAGYPDGKDFPSVKLSIVDDQDTRLTAEFLKEQLSENLGINVEVEPVEQGVFFDRYGAGDFQMTWLSWFADYADPENWLPQQFATTGSFNVFGYSNAQVDALLDQAATELDQTRRFALYDQAQQIIIGEQALTPVYHPERNYLVKAKVADLITTALDAEPGDWFLTNPRIMEMGAPASQPGE